MRLPPTTILEWIPALAVAAGSEEWRHSEQRQQTRRTTATSNVRKTQEDDMGVGRRRGIQLLPHFDLGPSHIPHPRTSFTLESPYDKQLGVYTSSTIQLPT